MTSGSYFIIFVAVVIYVGFIYSVNKICVKFADSENARKLGKLVYRENYIYVLWMGLQKLFLESYFDLVMCSFLGNSAFIRMNEWKSFWKTSDDRFSSIITMIFTFFVLMYPITIYRETKRIRGIPKSRLLGISELIMESIKPNDDKAAMYIFLFVMRRLSTGIVLVVLADWPMFQCSFLIIFSAMNVIFLVSVRPMDSKK